MNLSEIVCREICPDRPKNTLETCRKIRSRSYCEDYFRLAKSVRRSTLAECLGKLEFLVSKGSIRLKDGIEIYTEIKNLQEAESK